MTHGWQGKGSTRRWRTIRLRVLTRDQGLCQLRLPGCTTTAEHVHHLIGKQHGDDPALLVAACSHCNLAVGDPAGTDPKPTPRTQW